MDKTSKIDKYKIHAKVDITNYINPYIIKYQIVILFKWL